MAQLGFSRPVPSQLMGMWLSHPLLVVVSGMMIFTGVEALNPSLLTTSTGRAKPCSRPTGSPRSASQIAPWITLIFLLWARDEPFPLGCDTGSAWRRALDQLG